MLAALLLATATQLDLPDLALRSLAFPRRPGGSRAIALLLAPRQPRRPERAAPCGPQGVAASATLAWLAPGASTLETTAADLPGDARSIVAADLDGDGTDELLLVRPSELLVVAPQRRVLLAGSSITVAHLSEDAAPWILERAIDRVRFRRDPAALLADLPLAPETTLRDGWLSWRTPSLLPVGRDGAGHALFATLAQAWGPQRLRVWLFQPEAAAEARVAECWARLPAPETVLESKVFLLDGEPTLLVTTKPADRLSLFGEKRLRLFPLRRDRSRRGIAPRLALETRINLWQQTVPRLLDVDGDGRSDLVLGYWKGLSGDHVVLDAYLQQADGGFRTAPLSTSREVKQAEREVLGYGDDLDGDGRGDLFVLAAGELLLYPGLAPAHGRDLVASRPAVRLSLGEADAPVDPERLGLEVDGGGVEPVLLGGGSRAPRVVDLDGDGRPEIVLFHGANPRQLRVVSPAAAAAAAPRGAGGSGSARR
ncbi:MAG TPA: hypothetical protein VJS92_11840 [Candidatus Polarisedimenticolaceae bacterium]|nr:hypothetical protein [Candidatus Polarisedimenticolaceae bacterium]